MSDSPAERTPLREIEREAAAWVLRFDRGLTPSEQDAFFQWLAADPRHAAQLARHRRHWARLDQLVRWCPEHSARPNPDLLAPPLRRRLRPFLTVAVSLAAAAVAVTFFAWKPDAPRPGKQSPAIVAASSEGQRVLPDGSVIELNRGAAVTVDFTAAERRVRLERGEAYFTVAKDRAHPFIVTARGIDVQAVGTAFNVRLDAAVVEVLVTEGHVQVNSPGGATAGSGPRGQAPAAPVIPLLEANQRAVVSLSPQIEPPRIATLTRGEIERVLAWQHRLLDFTATPLSDMVAEFNRRNVVQLVLIDPGLASLRISASIRSDNIDGFLRLLEAGFGVRTERRSEFEILLCKAP